jgi:hypothetical protein
MRRLFLFESLGVANGEVFDPPVGVMDQSFGVLVPAAPGGHLERVEGQVTSKRSDTLQPRVCPNFCVSA